VAGQEQRERPPTLMLLTNWCWLSQEDEYACEFVASSWLNTSSSTASTLAVVCAVLGLPLPDSLVIDPVCFKLLIKSFNILFCHPLAGNSFVSLTASQHLANYFFIKIISILKPIVLLFGHIGVVVCFVVMATAAAGTPPY